MARKREQPIEQPSIHQEPKLYTEHRWMYLQDSYGTVRKCRVVGETGGSWLIGFSSAWEPWPMSEFKPTTKEAWLAFQSQRVEARFMAWLGGMSTNDRTAFVQAFNSATPEELWALMKKGKESPDV